MTDVMNIIARAYGRALPAKNASNARSVAVALDQYGNQFGVMEPQRLAQYLTQLFHESGSFRHDREVWGPTAAQRRYEGRKDLGNTQPGDGKKFAGHGPMQVTGRYNTTVFYEWCLVKFRSARVPNFVEYPELINTDPWEGVTALWYWDSRALNRYADENDIEMITRRINGGLNGYQDRLKWFTRVALVMLGYKPTDVGKFQNAQGLTIDNVSGPRTRHALHMALSRLNKQVPVRVDRLPHVITNKPKERAPDTPKIDPPLNDAPFHAPPDEKPKATLLAMFVALFKGFRS